MAEESQDVCSLCLDNFIDPRALPCIHSFCLECIKAYVDQKGTLRDIPCPMCRKAFSVNNSVETLPKNIYIVTQTIEKCEICPKHRGCVLDLHCDKCQCAICIECLLDRHNGHLTSKLTSAIEKSKTKASQKIQTLTEQAQFNKTLKIISQFERKMLEILHQELLSLKEKVRKHSVKPLSSLSAQAATLQSIPSKGWMNLQRVKSLESWLQAMELYINKRSEEFAFASELIAEDEDMFRSAVQLLIARQWRKNRSQLKQKTGMNKDKSRLKRVNQTDEPQEGTSSTKRHKHKYYISADVISDSSNTTSDDDSNVNIIHNQILKKSSAQIESDSSAADTTDSDDTDSDDTDSDDTAQSLPNAGYEAAND